MRRILEAVSKRSIHPQESPIIRTLGLIMEVTYVEDIATMAYLCHKPTPPEGFEEVTGDLNCGAFGRYIHLYVKRTSDVLKAITHIDVFSSSIKDIDIPPAYIQLPQDLNSLAGGKYIYLCYSKKMDRPPITDLRIICYPHVHPYKPWVRVGNNCNEGTFGKPIYITYRRAEPKGNHGDDTIVGTESKPEEGKHIGGDGDMDGPETESTPEKSDVAGSNDDTTIVCTELTAGEKQVDDGGVTDGPGKEFTPERNHLDDGNGGTAIVTTELTPEENHVGGDYTIIAGNEVTAEEENHVDSSDS